MEETPLPPPPPFPPPPPPPSSTPASTEIRAPSEEEVEGTWDAARGGL